MAQAYRVQAQELGVAVGRQHLLSAISLSCEAGEFVGVLGPSGCGKSTLLTTLAGWRRRSSGQVHIETTAIDALPAEMRRCIGFVPQDDIVHGPLTVDKALVYSARLRQVPADQIRTRVQQVLEQLELVERRSVRIDRLSGGQRKRVSIAVELLSQPSLIFLDEPTAGLDPALEEQFMDTCRQLSRDGRTVIMSTHVMQSLDRLDQVVILSAGWLQFAGPPAHALTYFGIDQLHQVYKILASRDARQGWEQFHASVYFNNFVAARLRPL